MTAWNQRKHLCTHKARRRCGNCFLYRTPTHKLKREFQADQMIHCAGDTRADSESANGCPKSLDQRQVSRYTVHNIIAASVFNFTVCSAPQTHDQVEVERAHDTINRILPSKLRPSQIQQFPKSRTPQSQKLPKPIL